MAIASLTSHVYSLSPTADCSWPRCKGKATSATVYVRQTVFSLTKTFSSLRSVHPVLSNANCGFVFSDSVTSPRHGNQIDSMSRSAPSKHFHACSNATFASDCHLLSNMLLVISWSWVSVSGSAEHNSQGEGSPGVGAVKAALLHKLCQAVMDLWQ